MSVKEGVPNQTVANSFVIWRVPLSMPIDKSMLLTNIETDVADAEDQTGFVFKSYSRRATPLRTLKFLLQRNLLTEKDGLISRNERTKRYVSNLTARVVQLIDGQPICDPLILLAGAGD